MYSGRLTVVFGIAVLVVIVTGQTGVSRKLNGDYCRSRPGAQLRQCCGGRQDDCSVPFMDTLCYCDDFCDRDRNDDCCPDYWTFCRGEIEPPALLRCFYKGKYYNVGDRFQFNCNECTCRMPNAEFVCEERGCLVRPDLIQQINQGNFGWKASNYSFFWGKSLDEGYQNRLGACKPEPSVMKQNSVSGVMSSGEIMEPNFDARRQWPSLIQPIHDQLEFPSSWALSTVDLAADRLAIQTRGLQTIKLSSQNLISCVLNRKNRCETGSTDRAWWHLNVYGVVSDECYPYTSGTTGDKGRCSVNRDKEAEMSQCPSGEIQQESSVYRSSPAYRISDREEDIMSEIKKRGPVQAIFKVKDDFFLYKSGVYRHTKLVNNHDRHHRHPYHAVRIIGWGIDRSFGTPTNYWLCANSWGSEWGENGYFRIVRGQNECDIEMFVIGVWAGSTQNGNGNLHSNSI